MGVEVGCEDEGEKYALPGHDEGFFAYSEVVDPRACEHEVFVCVGDCVAGRLN